MYRREEVGGGAHDVQAAPPREAPSQCIRVASCQCSMQIARALELEEAACLVIAFASVFADSVCLTGLLLTGKREGAIPAALARLVASVCAYSSIWREKKN